MLDKYKELSEKGLVDAGKVTIGKTGEGDSESITMTYQRFDTDTGAPMSPISEGMSRLEVEFMIDELKKRLEAWEDLYQKAFGTKPIKTISATPLSK